MKIGFKYKWVRGFGRVYAYSYNQTHTMITKSAEKRYHILCFWKKHGLQATTDAYKVKRSTLYYWDKLYRDGGRRVEALNPRSPVPKNKRRRIVDWRIIEEIRRLRIDVCPNMGKDKVKVFLNEFCLKHGLKSPSASTIGRIIKDKNIVYRHRRVYHNGRIKEFKQFKKQRLPQGFRATAPGELVELDTIVKFVSKVKRYILTSVDTYSRYSFAACYRGATSANAKDFFQKLELVFPYHISRIQTDNGSEFHKHFHAYLANQTKTNHCFTYPRSPQKQGHVERYNRTIQAEFINRNAFKLTNTKQFNNELMRYLIWHNTKRPHWSLNLSSPVDFLIKNHLLSKRLWTDTTG